MRRWLAGALALAGATACTGGPGVSASATEASASAGATTTAATTGTDGISSTTAVTSTSTSTASATESTSGSTTELEPCSSTFLQLCPKDSAYPECDVWAQDCPEGEKCSPYASDGGGVWDDSKCVPVVPDPDAVGEPCMVEGSGVSGIDTCALGTMCWNVDPETNMGQCVLLCQGSYRQCAGDPLSCCPPASTCTIASQGVLNVCFPTCDPLIQNCEANGDYCYPNGEDFVCLPDASGPAGEPGDPCDAQNACDPGTHCGDPSTYPDCDPNAPGCCIPFCDQSAPECAPGAECQPWYAEPAPLGYEHLGACRLP